MVKSINLSSWINDLFGARARARRGFKSQRAEYYQYLADLMEDAAGTRNFSEVFKSDAKRYAGTPRGVLSALWAEAYQENGADLAATWEPDLPVNDVMVIRVAQESGGTGIVQALRDMARVSRVIDSAVSEMIWTVSTGAIGILVALMGALAVPYFLEPQISKTFESVPQDQWGPTATNYKAFSDLVKAAWLPFVLFFGGLVGLIKWALPNYIGSWRRWLDEHFLVFSLYRDFRGALFMAVLASLVKRRKGGGEGMRLVGALNVLGKSAEAWMHWHISQIVDRINRTGGLNSEVFATGLLDPETLFYMADLVESKGFEEGLEKAGLRTEQRASAIVRKRSIVLRWGLLAVGLVTVIGLTGWSFAVIFEMKDVMMQVLSQ